MFDKDCVRFAPVPAAAAVVVDCGTDGDGKGDGEETTELLRDAVIASDGLTDREAVGT